MQNLSLAGFGMKMAARLAGLSVLLCLSSCVKVPLNNTDHPEHGIITLTTVWDDRNAELDIPAEHAVRTKHSSSEHSHAATRSGTVNTLDELFPAGEHRIHIYNVADRISVNGTTATADYAAGVLGWLFTGAENLTVEKDKVHAVTVVMHQQVRQLSFELEIEGSGASHITGVVATLSGVAGAINIENGNPEGAAVTVAPVFAQVEGKYMASLRLLGVAGTSKTLTLQLYTHDSAAPVLTVNSNVTSLLAGFNADRKTPLSLRSKLTVNIDETSAELVLSASLDDWQSDGSTNGTAD